MQSRYVRLFKTIVWLLYQSILTLSSYSLEGCAWSLFHSPWWPYHTPPCSTGHHDDFKEFISCIWTGWQKLRGSRGGTRRKVWTRTKILSPNIRYFVANWDLLRFTHFFLRSLGIKSAFLGENSASWARSALLHGIYCIFYWVKFENLRLRAKTTHLSRKL